MHALYFKREDVKEYRQTTQSGATYPSSSVIQFIYSLFKRSMSRIESKFTSFCSSLFQSFVLE